MDGGSLVGGGGAQCAELVAVGDRIGEASGMKEPPGFLHAVCDFLGAAMGIDPPGKLGMLLREARDPRGVWVRLAVALVQLGPVLIETMSGKDFVETHF